MNAAYVFRVEFRLDPEGATIAPDRFETTMELPANEPGTDGWLFFRDRLWRGEIGDEPSFRRLASDRLGVEVVAANFRELRTDEAFRRAAVGDRGRPRPVQRRFGRRGPAQIPRLVGPRAGGVTFRMLQSPSRPHNALTSRPPTDGPMAVADYDFHLFDLDGTLVDAEWSYTRGVFDRVSDRLGRPFSDREAYVLWHGLGGARGDTLRDLGIDPDAFWPAFHAEEDPDARAEATYLHDDAADCSTASTTPAARPGSSPTASGSSPSPCSTDLTSATGSTRWSAVPTRRAGNPIRTPSNWR